MSRTKVNYRSIWEEYHNACILSGMHIHHIDGNSHNNDPGNLLICTPHEHWDIHQRQGNIRCLNGKFVQGAAIAGKLGGIVSRGWKYTNEQSKRLSNALKDSYVQRGGSPLKNKLLSKEHKLNIGLSIRGEKNGMHNKKHTEKSKDKMTKKRKGIIGREAGWKHDEATLNLISKKSKEHYKAGGLNPKAKFYEMYDINGKLLYTNVSSYDIISKLDIDMRTFKTIMAYMRRNDYTKPHPKYGVKINVL